MRVTQATRRLVLSGGVLAFFVGGYLGYLIATRLLGAPDYLALVAYAVAIMIFSRFLRLLSKR